MMIKDWHITDENGGDGNKKKAKSSDGNGQKE